MSIEPKKLTDDLSVAGQIMPDQVDQVKDLGFKSVIINRPDFEKPGQPIAADLEKLLEEAGLKTSFLPMSPGHLTPELLTATSEAFDALPKPILAFCASGTRSTILWCCVNVKALGTDTVLNTANKAGYDLQQIRPLLEQLSG
jgi:sulfide:quinone oxidoreductase